MKVTKELIENDIRNMEAQLENLKSQISQAIGAIATLKGVRDYMDKPEPVVENEPVVEKNEPHNDVEVEEPHLG